MSYIYNIKLNLNEFSYDNSYHELMISLQLYGTAATNAKHEITTKCQSFYHSLKSLVK